MPDMRDVLTKAIQSYSPSEWGDRPNMLMLALGPGLAEHLVNTLPLVQQWAVGTEINGKLDEIEPDTETEVRDDALRDLASMQEELRGWKAREYRTPEELSHSYALYTSFGIDWVPETEPDIEDDLAQLVLNDEDDGASEPDHDWQPTGFQ